MIELTDADRTAIQAICRAGHPKGSHPDVLAEREAIFLAGMRAMAERCAKVCDEKAAEWANGADAELAHGAQICADAIRAQVD